MKDAIYNTYFFYFFILICFIGYSQNEVKKKVYYIKVINEFAAPTFDKQGSYFEYSGNNSNEEVFFSKYDITAFRQAYPNSNRVNLRNAFILETNSSEIASDLLTTFPEIYTAVEDITDQKAELSTTTYTPPDFTTSAIRIPFDTITYDRSELLYIDAPKAWGITDTISKTITLGISDAKVDDQTNDLLGKVTYINPYGSSLAVNCNSLTTHGTGTSIIAAGIGDNGEGTTGVCYDCDIIATSWEFGTGYNNLLLLAQNGVKVINMSWGVTSSLPPDQYTASSSNCLDQQECINEIVEDYGVVLVAASGNDTSFDSNGPNLLYDYPASYNNVISVSSVNHWYTVANYPVSETVYDPPGGDKYIEFIEDSVAPLVNIDSVLPNPVGVYSQYWNPDDTFMHTLNEEVDILAPGYSISRYGVMEGICTTNNIAGKYGSGTSQAAPIVTGTIGLMLTINECLTPAEVESILKLTTKDIEVNPMNNFAIGYIGAGKLETGNAVEFVNEMRKSNGIATIKDHIFYRYDFDLQKFNNDLIIENVVLKDDVNVNFVVKNSVNLKEGTHLVPNNNGVISIKADNSINDSCLPNNNRQSVTTSSFENVKQDQNTGLTIYPNPTTDTISITLKDRLDTITIFEVYTMQGNLVLSQANIDSKNTIYLSMSNLKSGMYLIKTITKNNEVLTSKVIKK